MHTSLAIIFSLFLMLSNTQDFPKEYEMGFKVNASFGSQYQVKQLLIHEDLTYEYHYYQSINKKAYLKSNHDVEKAEKGSWTLKGDRLILNSNKGTSWQLIVDSRWNLYFLGTNDSRGSKFKKNK